MMVYIPTMGRVSSQSTLKSLDYPFFKDKVVIVCPSSEAHSHISLGRNVLSVPEHVTGIAATRHFIMENAGEFVLMMDDDLTFSARRADAKDKFREVTEVDMRFVFAKLYELLGAYAHVSMSMREGANRRTEDLLHCSRVARVIGYRKSVYFESGADFRNSTVMDDFEVTLHLLTRGYENAILNTHVHNQRGSGTKGGAATYRTLEMHAEAAKKLASRYPQFVKTVQKTTKTAWGGNTRTDVLVQWKQAYASGMNTYGERAP